MADDRVRLAETEAELAAVRKHIAHEHQFIAEAEREGHHTSLAKRSLVALHNFRHAIVQHRRILLERLGLYRH